MEYYQNGTWSYQERFYNYLKITKMVYDLYTTTEHYMWKKCHMALIMIKWTADCANVHMFNKIWSYCTSKLIMIFWVTFTLPCKVIWKWRVEDQLTFTCICKSNCDYEIHTASRSDCLLNIDQYSANFRTFHLLNFLLLITYVRSE